MRDLILLIFLLFLIFDGCSVKYSINGEAATFKVQGLLETMEKEREDENNNK